MQPNETQPNNPQDDIQLTNDELAAAMGYMTTLGDQQMQAQMQPEPEYSIFDRPAKQESKQNDISAKLDKMDDKLTNGLTTLKDEMSGENSEIEAIKKELEQLLEE